MICLRNRSRSLEHLLIDLKDLLQIIAVGQSVTEIQDVVTNDKGNEEHNKHCDGNRLAIRRVLHALAVLFQRGILTNLFIECSICHIVVSVVLEILECKKGHSSLISHIQEDIVVGQKMFVQPCQLGCRTFSLQCRQWLFLPTIDAVMLVEIDQGCISTGHSFLVFSIKIALISKVRVFIRHVQPLVIILDGISFGQCLFGCSCIILHTSRETRK